MLLRYIAIFVLVLIALRLIGRLVRALTGSGAASAAAVQPQDRGGESRQLEACAHCGTYFDPARALASPAGTPERFCSPACVDAHRLEDGSA